MAVESASDYGVLFPAHLMNVERATRMRKLGSPGSFAGRPPALFDLTRLSTRVTRRVHTLDDGGTTH
jgi:hypothetical protein